MMVKISKSAELEGKYTNSSGRKTVIQALRDEFDPLEISELTGHANPESISSYSHNPMEKQRRMSNKLAGFTEPTATTTTQPQSSSNAVALQVQPEPEASAIVPVDTDRITMQFPAVQGERRALDFLLGM